MHISRTELAVPEGYVLASRCRLCGTAVQSTLKEREGSPDGSNLGVTKSHSDRCHSGRMRGNEMSKIIFSTDRMLVFQDKDGVIIEDIPSGTRMKIGHYEFGEGITITTESQVEKLAHTSTTSHWLVGPRQHDSIP